jgi:hypothetical protein
MVEDNLKVYGTTNKSSFDKLVINLPEKFHSIVDKLRLKLDSNGFSLIKIEEVETYSWFLLDPLEDSKNLQMWFYLPEELTEMNLQNLKLTMDFCNEIEKYCMILFGNIENEFKSVLLFKYGLDKINKAFKPVEFKKLAVPQNGEDLKFIRRHLGRNITRLPRN